MAGRYRAGRGDLADYLLGAQAEALGAETTVSLDRALRSAPGVALLE